MHKDYAIDTEPLKKLWNIEMCNLIPKITWDIVTKCPLYSLSEKNLLVPR